MCFDHTVSYWAEYGNYSLKISGCDRKEKMYLDTATCHACEHFQHLEMKREI